MINKRALEKAINDTMREQFAAQMREFLCFGAPKEVTELYKRYVDECIAEDERRKNLFRAAGYVAAFCVCVFLLAIATGQI